MVFGYLLINTKPTHESKVYTQLIKLSDVVELYPLFGEYDLIAKINSESFDNLGEIINTKIKSIAGIVDTKVLTGTGS